MIGVVMLLVSSLGLINGIRDVMQANFISGFLEIMNSLLGAFGIAFGIALAMMLMKWNGTDHFVINPSVWIQIVSCTIGCIGYASWFGIRGKKDGIFRNRRIHYMGNLFACICMQWK